MVLYVVFLLLALFMLALPEQFWMVTEQWKSTDATEPSALFVLSTRVGGTMFLILGILGLIFVR